jgi:sulfur carrier protein ThiS
MAFLRRAAMLWGRLYLFPQWKPRDGDGFSACKPPDATFPGGGNLLRRLTFTPAPLYNAAMESKRNSTTLLHRGRRFEVPSGSTLRDAIRKVGLSPEAVLATQNGELITDDRILKPGEEIRLVAVISGG